MPGLDSGIELLKRDGLPGQKGITPLAIDHARPWSESASSALPSRAHQAGRSAVTRRKSAGQKQTARDTPRRSHVPL
jgi:hypothetical protein